MIGIFSISQGEVTTDEVIRWLHHYSAGFKRVNADALINGKHKITFQYEAGESRLLIDGIDIDNIRVVWHRKWLYANSFMKEELDDLEIGNSTAHRFKEGLLKEFSRICSVLFKKIARKPSLLSSQKAGVNKIHVIEVASRLGLKVPKTLISNDIDGIEAFCENMPNGTISKPVNEVLYFREGQDLYSNYTHLLNSKELADFIRELRFPSLFQEYIPKQYELRVFYLAGQCYSMAIFSQNDDQTKVDFRKYNDLYPNRTVPYQLPEEVESKINALMEELSLNTGSIDLLRAVNGEYYFLEVNPGGQLGMTSKPCNYHLEKRIAAYLIELRNEVL